MNEPTLGSHARAPSVSRKMNFIVKDFSIVTSIRAHINPSYLCSRIFLVFAEVLSLYSSGS